MDLIQYFQEIGAYPSRENLSLKRKTIRSVGLLIRQFHQAGFFHGDLPLLSFFNLFYELIPIFLTLSPYTYKNKKEVSTNG